MTHASLIIAASRRGSSLVGEVLPGLLVLAVIVIVGGIILVYLRRTIKENRDGSPGGFTLQDLRDLHAAGKFTDEEFEQAKSAMIGRLKSPEEPSRNEKKPDNAHQTTGNDSKSESPPK